MVAGWLAIRAAQEAAEREAERVGKLREDNKTRLAEAERATVKEPSEGHWQNVAPSNVASSRALFDVLASQRRGEQELLYRHDSEIRDLRRDFRFHAHQRTDRSLYVMAGGGWILSFIAVGVALFGG